jgi:tetratricopeptide (TPR) repeat protein
MNAAAARTTKDDPKKVQAENRVRTALRLRSEGRWEEALEVLSAPGAYAQDVYTLRGDLQRDLERLDEAAGSYSTVIALDPQNAYAQQQLAGCLRRLGRWNTAMEAFRKILAHDSYSDAARLGLGDCLLHENLAEDALACFEACWSEAALAPALFGKAAALQMLRRFEESEMLYLRFLEWNPLSEEALGNLIAFSMEIFDLARAERYANRLLDLNSRSVIALQALTVVAFERRAYESASEYYRRLLEVIPEEQLVRGESENDDVFEYRLSRKNRELLHRRGPGEQPEKPYV